MSKPTRGPKTKVFKREELAFGCLKSVRLKSTPYGVGKLTISFNSCGYRTMGVSFAKDTQVRLVIEHLENPERKREKGDHGKK